MESLAASQVNTTPPVLMMTIGEIAQRDGITSAAVSKSVSRLAASHGLGVQRDFRNRVTGVNVAQYDDLKGKHGDPAHDQTPADDKPSTYEDARTRQALYDGERSRIRLEQEIGTLVSRADVETAMADAGERIARAIDQIGADPDALAAAYSSGGLQGLRVKLKDLIHEARVRVAATLEEMATADQAPDDSAP
jgi:hypothetical protein